MAKINDEYLKARLQAINKRKEENSKYLSLKDGENKIELDLSVFPVEQPPKGSYAARMLWTTTTQKNINGKTINLILSASLTLDSLITKALAEGHNPFTLIKVGRGIDTRYAIKELGENQ